MKRKLTRNAARPRLTPDGFEPGAIVQRGSGDAIARLTPSTYDSKGHTVEAVLSTGARVARWGVYEELAVTPEAIDLSRVALGQVRILDTHNQYAVDAILGVLLSARVEGGQLVGTLKFADTEEGRKAEGMVARGELTGVSVGYRVTTWTLTSTINETEIWRADKWELLEASLVAVPADPHAAIRSTPAASPANHRADAHHEENDMRRNVPPAGQPAETSTAAAAEATRSAAPAAPASPAAPAAVVIETRAAPVATAADVSAERARAADINSIGTRAGMPADAIETALRDGTGVEVFRTRAFDHLAAQADRTRTSAVSVGQDETETRRAHLTDALTVRIGGAQALRNAEGTVVAISEGARRFERHSIAEMASEVLGARSAPRTAAEREDTLRRAFHTTTDFPIIFESSINRVLASRYALQAPTYRRIAAKRNFRDFRPHDQVRVGDFPMPVAVGQSGEIKFGTWGENKESVAVAPYAVQFAITRRMLVDDHLGAIDQMIGSYGDVVALFEEVTFYAMKNVAAGLGPTLVEDASTVFHTANHGNLAAAGTVIDTTNLGKARAAMRKQKNKGGNLINVSARTLLVGPDKETEAEMAVASVTATKAADFNPFSGKLEVVASAQITGNAWELYADPAMLPVFVWGLLDGYTAPRLRLDNPFGVQGVGVSLEHDFGAGAIDFRGAYRNPGA
jgi:HK97 family phage prohead protease